MMSNKRIKMLEEEVKQLKGQIATLTSIAEDTVKAIQNMDSFMVNSCKVAIIHDKRIQDIDNELRYVKNGNCS